MRTTVTLDDDVAAAIEQVRRAEAIGVSEAVNRLVRQGLAARRTASAKRTPFRQPAVRLGLSVDVSNVAEALELLEGPHAR